MGTVFRRVLPVLSWIFVTALWAPHLWARHFVLAPVLQNQGDVVGITHAGDERLFLVSKEGRVWILRGGTRLGTPFLDIRDRVLFTGEDESEQGLLSVAFHPRYSENGFFFAAYTRRDGTGVVARFSVSGPNPDRASSGSERVLLEVPQPGPNHNLNHLAFGPEGYLYVSSGDGGYQPEPRCTPQDGRSLLGKILRLDVDASVDAPPYHAVPGDNPFVGDAGFRDEIWALGLRNPWRFDFDSATGDLWLADVGQHLRDEVNFLPAGQSGGQNWGFKMMEGSVCRGSAAGCGFPIPGCFDPAYSPPLFDNGHDGRHCAIIGGFVYRGTAIPALRGSYLVGDYCGATSLIHRRGSGFEREELTEDLFGLVTFGESADGEAYLLADGVLYRLTGLAEDAAVAFRDPEPRVSEAAGSISIPVRRAGGTGTAVSVSYAVTGLSADAQDLELGSGVLAWPAGDGGDRFIELQVFDDAELEGNERFQVELFDPVGAELGAPSRVEGVIVDDEGAGVCVPSSTVLCLGSERFRVSVVWRDFEGNAGPGNAVPLGGVVDDPQGTGSSGLVWFFRSDNVELLVKTLDACGVNGHHWVFLAAATSVDYTVEVVDSLTGRVRTYRNPLGTASPATTDTSAFECP